MKLLLLHGSAKQISRKKLLEIKGKFDPNNVIVFESSSDSQTVFSYLMTPSFLSEEQLIILENPDESLNFDSLTHNDSLTLILWFDHEVSDKKPILVWVKKNNGQILYFPESKEISVFPFLDLLAQGNIKAFLEMKKLKMAGYDIFYFNTMTLYLLRNLVATPKNAPQFVKEKLKKQKVRFNQQSLTNLYKNILELDFKLKSGLIESQQAEFLLVNRFINSSFSNDKTHH